MWTQGVIDLGDEGIAHEIVNTKARSSEDFQLTTTRIEYFYSETSRLMKMQSNAGARGHCKLQRQLLEDDQR